MPRTNQLASLSLAETREPVDGALPGLFAAPGRVPGEYREICLEGRATLRRHREALDGLSTDSAAFAEAASALSEDWRALWVEAHEAVRPLMADPLALAAAKCFTEATLTPELVAGPVWRRSYEKPLGYPGDYQIMNFIYDDQPQGEDAYATALHGLGLEIGEFVRVRMEMMHETIVRTVYDHGGADREARITSVGCGPAREVANYLAAAQPPHPVCFSLIDYEKQALFDASRRCAERLVELDGQAEIRPLHASVRQLIRNPGGAGGRQEPQDLIYSVGLLDYFSQERCRKLVQRMFDMLAEGGLLVLGNVKAGTDLEWPLEFIADWAMTYRTAPDMLDLADSVDTASVDLYTDSTGYDYFLFIRKAGLKSRGYRKCRQF